MIAALPLAWKIGAPVGIVLAIIGGYLGWQHYQQSIGRAEAEAEYQAELFRQQQEAIGHFIVSEAQKLRTVERAGAAKDALNAKLRQSYQEVVAYEAREPVVPELQRPACAISPDLVRTVNGLARLLGDVATQRPAAAGGTAGEPAGSRGGAAAGAGGGGDGSGSRETDPRADGTPDEPHH